MKGKYEMRPYVAEQMWCTTGFDLSRAIVGDTHRKGEEGRSMILSQFLPTFVPELRDSKTVPSTIPTLLTWRRIFEPSPDHTARDG